MGSGDVAVAMSDTLCDLHMHLHLLQKAKVFKQASREHNVEDKLMDPDLSNKDK